MPTWDEVNARSREEAEKYVEDMKRQPPLKSDKELHEMAKSLFDHIRVARNAGRGGDYNLAKAEHYTDVVVWFLNEGMLRAGK